RDREHRRPAQELGVANGCDTGGARPRRARRVVEAASPRPTASRSWCRASSRGVRLGPGLLGLVAPLLATLRVAETGLPQLVELAQRCGETISISVWDGAGAVNLEQVLGARAVKHYAARGSRNPAHATASGK